jgi:nucleoside-diphosphate-sugar epimerase
MSQRCLLTGASGYLGGLIAKKLAASGWDVVAMTRNPKLGEIAFKLGEDIDPAALAGADALIHCAYDFAPVEWDDIAAINIEGAERLLRAAKQAGVKHIVLISTISAFNGCKSKYGLAKLAIESAGREVGACIIRPGLIYGASPGAMFGRLVKQVRAASIMPMPGDGRQMMYTVHEDDLTQAILNGLSRTPAPPVTVAHDSPIAFRDIMSAIGAKLGRKVTAIPIPWRFMWLGLRGAEIARVPLGLRSDSLISLVIQDVAPRLNAEAELGVSCRPFSLAEVAL